MSSLGTPQKGQGGKSGTRQLRNRLALTTILTVAPFFGYGRTAYAACDPAPASPTFVCTGNANVVTQAITADNADVSTAPGFSVIAPVGNGITITGDGHLRFTDENASIITGDEDGLSVSAAGDAGSTPGTVTVTVNSTITGGFNGLRARNDGTGDLVVTADGKVTGQNGSGILAGAGASGRDLTVNTGAQSDIAGDRFGIDARSSSTGDLFVNANGKVTAIDGDGMHAFTTGRDLTITTGADSVITGSRFGMIGRNDGTGDLAITVNGDVTGMVREGVYALGNSTANNVTVTIAAGSVVKGGYDGVEARNIGRGALNVNVYGDVTGTVQNGVWVVNYAGTGATVTTGAQSKVTGYDGIGGRNDSGDFTITANGEVTGTDRNGIYARNLSSGDLKIATGAASDVKGQQNGIDSRMIGTGDIEIIANGKVTGTEGMGIYALSAAGGGDMTITTGAGSTVAGFNFGITGMNKGAGDLTITANGNVTAQNGGGVAVYGRNFGDAGDITITTGAGSYLKGDGGIRLLNNAAGDAKIDVGGRVNARFYGIDAGNGLASDRLEITTRAGSDVSGAFYGIHGRNAGGDLIISVAGDVTASAGHAIMARNQNTADDLIVTVEATSTVEAQSGGIIATNRGTGVTEITVRGVVEGMDGTGIHATSTTAGGGVMIATSAGSRVTGGLTGIQAFDENDLAIDITVDGDVRGVDENGVYARNFGYGGADIKVGATGRVQGMVAGIDVASTGGKTVVDNAGLITATNLMAINVKGAPAEITNIGVINGRVDLTGGDDRLDNLTGGVFTAYNSDFGAGNDVVNNAGLVQAAHGIAEFENTTLWNLEAFNNSGTISLVDGLQNDGFSVGPAAKYVGYGGRLAVDAFLAPGVPGKSDLLIINGDASGTTNLVVNLTNPIGSAPNIDGIRVVIVSGNSLEEDFNIEGGVLNAGFFAWDLRRVEEGGDVVHELYTAGLGAGAYEFAASITGAQDMWQQTTGTLLQRQADLRPLLGATQVTPVADFADPVDPTPVGRVTPGLWFKAVGGWLNRDGDTDNNVVLDRRQTVFGGIAGFDFGTENVSGQGDALLFGLFGGYLTSKLTFDSTNTEWKYDGPTIGAYATYLKDAFYADLVVKADFLDIDIDADDLAPDAEADTNATNIGGQIDLGYKIGFGHGAFIEPQASLSVLHTEIDDIDDIFGGSVEFEDETSVRGRLGLRLGADYEHDGLLLTPDVTASVWQSFSGDNNVTVLAPLTPASDVSDDPGETMGDVSLGLAVTAPDGWTGFLRGNYQFAEDFDAITGAAGLRYAW